MYKGNSNNWFKGNTYFKIGTKIRQLQGMVIKFKQISLF